MNLILILTVIFSQAFSAHHEHGGETKAASPLPGSSIFQLKSEWTNQKGGKIKLTDLQGSPHLVVMLYTRCETACPLIVADLKKVAEDAGAAPGKIEVSIFSLDSFRESAESLSAFAAKRKLPPFWGLFTSDANSVAELAASLGVRYKRLPNGDFIHSNVIYFLNKNGEIVTQKEGIGSPRVEFIKNIKKNI